LKVCNIICDIEILVGNSSIVTAFPGLVRNVFCPGQLSSGQHTYHSFSRLTTSQTFINFKQYIESTLLQKIIKNETLSPMAGFKAEFIDPGTKHFYFYTFIASILIFRPAFGPTKKVFKKSYIFILKKMNMFIDENFSLSITIKIIVR
jgi:hypothetical protein